jgi:xanthosine utilization system XapX-like protein
VFDRLRAAGTTDWDRRREELRRRISDLAKGCNDEASRVYGRLLWRDLQLQRLLSRELGQPVVNLKVFVGALANGLHVTVEAPPLAALCGLLERLAGTDVDYPALATLVGAEVDSPVYDVLGELRGTLAGTHPATSGRPDPAPDKPKTTKSRYAYRD